MRIAMLLLACAAGAVASATSAGAHDFDEPTIAVAVSVLEPGGHPDLQTTIDLATGTPFDQTMIVGPAGSGIASDADIPDGTVVGRLDAVATTNATTRPECDTTAPFTVPIIEATTDETSPGYPAYLPELAPGPHRLRFTADVSPSPDIPVIINYLFDLDDATGSVISRVFVGDPDNPPSQLITCTPLRSTNTIFGELLDATPVLTSPDPLPAAPLPFQFTLTSKADADGERHEQAVEVIATTQVAPTVAPELTLFLLGATSRIDWAYDGLPESFIVEVVLTPIGGGAPTVQTFSVSGGRREFSFGPDIIPPFCDRPLVRFRVASVANGVTGPFGESESIGGCVEGPENPMPVPSPNASDISGPNAGSGPAAEHHGAATTLATTLMAIVASIAVAAVAFGIALRSHSAARRVD